MTVPNFLTPAWALMGLLAIPLILLYILRQRRPNQPVSSTLLWSKTLADMRASTPFQKLRRNLLLLIQLLILAVLVFTLMRPVIQAQASQSKAGVIVIDATASMQAHDDGASESRLDRAKAEAHKLIDSMRPADQFMLIADGGGMAQVRSGFSSSKSELHSLIDSVQPSDTGSDLSESLLLASTSLRAIGAEKPAAGSAGPKSTAIVAGKIWLFSDGAGVKVPDAMGDTSTAAGILQFVKVGVSDHNIGITRVEITPLKEDKTYQVFVGLKNDWDTERRVGILLAAGTKENFLPDQAQFVTLPPRSAGGNGTAVFEKVVAEPGKLFVRLDDKDDDLALDNTAYGIITPSRKVRILLVTPGNEVLERFVTAAAKIGIGQPEIIVPQAYTPDHPADLVIFDGFLPPADKMPKADTLIFRPNVTGAGEIGGFKISHLIDNPPILRWRREEPAMQVVNLDDLRISRALLLDKDPGVIELVSAPEGGLIAYRDIGPVRRYFVGFSPLLESNWYRINSFLVFMQNIVDQTRLRHYIGIPELLPSGSPAKLWYVGDDQGEGKVTIALPDGSRGTVLARDGSAEFGETDKLGFYEVTGAQGKTSLFAVNLLSPNESDIRPRSLQTAPGSNIEEATSVATVNKEIWRWLAAAGLGVLLVEWWVYHRRI